MFLPSGEMLFNVSQKAYAQNIALRLNGDVSGKINLGVPFYVEKTESHSIPTEI